MNPALLDHFAEQARFCAAFGSAFTARLIEHLGHDLAAGGPTADLVADWPRSPRADAVSLRLAGALHAAALAGRDPGLAAQYPPQRSDWDGAAVWQAARVFLARERAWVADFLRSAPQTNEPNRAIALLAGFLDLTARFGLPLAMLELGASAGVNQCWDRFAYRTDSWSFGDAASPVTIETDWRGPPPPLAVRPQVQSRAACDLAPRDLADADERLRLRAYIWPDQPHRLARFDAADLAVATGVHVEQADAAAWLEARLPRRPSDALTVVYHSVFFQYPPRATRERIAAAIERAGGASETPLAWLRLEPEAALDGPRDSARFVIDLITWPGAERRRLGITDGHVRFVDAKPA